MAKRTLDYEQSICVNFHNIILCQNQLANVQNTDRLPLIKLCMSELPTTWVKGLTMDKIILGLILAQS